MVLWTPKNGGISCLSGQPPMNDPNWRFSVIPDVKTKNISWKAQNLGKLSGFGPQNRQFIMIYHHFMASLMGENDVLSILKPSIYLEIHFQSMLRLLRPIFLSVCIRFCMPSLRRRPWLMQLSHLFQRKNLKRKKWRRPQTGSIWGLFRWGDFQGHHGFQC